MNWRPYLSLFRIRMIAGMQYRVATFASMSIAIFYGFVLVSIMLLFYRLGHRQDIGLTLTQAVTYIWFGQCFIGLVPMGLDTEVYQKITSGDFAYELCRPMDLYSHWFVRSLSSRLSSTIPRAAVILVFCHFLPEPYNMQLPVSVWALLACVVALGGALLLSAALSNVMNTLLLRVELGPGVVYVCVSVIVVFSGLLIPIAVFPDWLQPILRLLPFAGLIDFPAALYTGVFHVSEAWMLFLRQICWIVFLIWLGRWRLNVGVRRTVFQGG